MIRCPTAYLALEGFEPGLSGGALLAGELLFVADDRRLLAARIDGAHREWELARSKPPPARYQAPRAVRSRGPGLWAGQGRVVQLLDADEGVVLCAHQGATGQELWRLELPTPEPLSWTEARPAWDGADTEELGAFLVASDVLAVALARTTRRTTLWPDHPAPEFHAQLEVTRVGPSDGRVAWRSSFPEVHVPAVEQTRFAGWHLAGRRLRAIDWVTGAARDLADLPGEPSWPRPIGGHLGVATRSRGAVAVELLDGSTGERLRRAEWRRTGVRDTHLHACGDQAVLQVNEQLVSLLSDDLTPRWEARTKPYVYGVAGTGSGPVFVGTAGNGGGLYAFEHRDGAPLAEVRLRGGAWAPSCVGGTELVASPCGDGLAVADGRDGRVEVVEVPGAQVVAGSRDGRVVVLSGAPRPGVQVVDVRRVFG